MFISLFRGLGTSLVEGCAGDFRPNAAECDRVHPSACQRASGACQSAQAEPWPIDRPKPAIDRLSKTIWRSIGQISRPIAWIRC